MKRVKATVFASGAGSNFQAIMENTTTANYISLLVCDKPGAAVIEKAKTFGVPTVVFNPNDFATKADYEQLLLEKLQSFQIDWIFLAGYTKIIGPTLLKPYEGKIVNIHPSLLPEFPGLDAIGRAYRSEATKTGVSIHFVDEGMDTGPIIMQKEIPILPNDTVETLAKRIHELEHALYPTVIRNLIQSDVANNTW